MTPLRFGLVGDPVRNSASPALHRAAYAALGLPHGYELLPTAPGELAARVDALRAGVFAGLNVTAPYKVDVLGLVDAVDPSAAAVGAANTLARGSAGEVRASNTDAPALEVELRRLAGGALEGPALVLGAGGAARAAVVALARLGCREIVVRSRSLASPARARALEVELGDALRADGLTPALHAGPLEPGPRDGALAAIVQATRAGMGAEDGGAVAAAVSWGRVPEGAIALDVVYGAGLTPFLLAARARGLPCVGGEGMLMEQAARALELWLGVEAPRVAMRAALSGPVAPRTPP